VFSQDHPYFPDSCKNCDFYTPTFTDNLRNLFLAAKRKDCYHCKFVNRCINDVDKEKKELLKQRRSDFKALENDENYIDVVYDKKTGGLKATHRGHIVHNAEKEEKFFEGLTSTDLEKECQDWLFQLGHKALLCDESKKRNGNYLSSLDLNLDDNLMDIRSITGHGWYSNVFVSKNKQLRKFNRRDDVLTKADSLCLYFHDPSLFDDVKMKKSIKYFRFCRDNNGGLLERELKHVYCVIKGERKILKFDI